MRITRYVFIFITSIALFGCSHQSDDPMPPAHVSACSSDPYLAKYNCSVERVQVAAEHGDPDAQYALGYMYYYGIETAKDEDSARLWIARAAAQNQPLAKRAFSMLSGNQPVPRHNVRTPINHAIPAYSSIQQHAAQKRSQSKAAKTETPLITTTQSTQVPQLKQMETALMNEPQNGYTLQLMGNHKESVLKDFVKSHHIEQGAKYYYSTFNKSRWYMLTYGQYKTVGEAHAAISKLPADLRKMQPWIKPNRDVKAEIKTRHLVS